MMKHYTLTLLLFTLVHAGLAQNDTIITHNIQCPDGAWELVFSEEFESNRLNTENWITWFPYTDDGSDQCGFCRTHGNGGQIYRDENVVINNGVLNLTAKFEPNSWFGVQRDYTSGMIHSRQSFGIGKYEIRCRLPKGMGFWPAIWLFGANVAELDILEAGMQHPRRFHMSIHNYQIKKMLHKRHCDMKELSSEFHTYTMVWDSSFIQFSLDHKVVWKVSPYKYRFGCRVKKCEIKPGKYQLEPIFPPSDETVHLILNLCIGNETTPFTKSPDSDTVFPNQMEIDWIRYYKRKHKND
ncbi:MAG: glycoside hydrolase family 16 protein [Bacteroidota bacterium]